MGPKGTSLYCQKPVNAEFETGMKLDFEPRLSRIALSLRISNETLDLSVYVFSVAIFSYGLGKKLEKNFIARSLITL